jgi:hypothetical protein
MLTGSEAYQEKLRRFLEKSERRKEKEKEKAKKKQREYERVKARRRRRRLALEKAENEGKTKTRKRKKKIGRPRKPGPKKKRVRRKQKPVVRTYHTFDYKMVSMFDHRQNGYVGQFITYADAYAKMQSLKEENERVVFPRKYMNKGNVKPVVEEYLILEKNRDGTKDDGMARNEYGKFVAQKIVNNDKWVVRDKCEKLTEETFWVYGYDPKVDRKDFMWIYDNFITGCLANSYDIIRVSIYKNKLLLRYDDRELNMVMCKNGSDAIRFYNTLKDMTEKKRVKQVVYVGSHNRISEQRRAIEAEIMELTGWSKNKVQRSTN